MSATTEASMRLSVRSALPVSSAISRPSSSLCSLSSRPHSATSLPRSRAAVLAHSFCALVAASTARATPARRGVVDLDQHVARRRLRMLERLRDIVDRPARDAGLAQDLDLGGSGLAAKDRIERAAQRAVVAIAQIVGLEARIRREIGASERGAQFDPQPGIAGGNDDVPVPPPQPPQAPHT